MKHTEKHHAVILYPRSTRPYIAVDHDGHPAIFSRKSAAIEHRQRIVSRSSEPNRKQTKVARVTVSFETP